MSNERRSAVADTDEVATRDPRPGLAAKAGFGDRLFGGSARGAAVFILILMAAIAGFLIFQAVEAIGKDKVGIRLSPYGVFNDMPLYPEMEKDYAYLADKLNAVGLVYVHLVDHSSQGAPEVPASIKKLYRDKFKRTLILSGGYDLKSAEADLAAGKADLIAVGKAGGRHVGKSDAGRPTTSGFDDTVVALARKTHIPLLIVPQEAGCIPPKVIAVTKELLAGEIPGALRELIGHFACRLYLFEVKAKTRSENVEVYVADAIHSAKELFHLLYEIPVDSKLQHSMENFIDVVPIDWLVARSLPSLTPERWLLGGHSRELAFDIRVPLLILPETEKKTARRDRKKSP